MIGKHNVYCPCWTKTCTLFRLPVCKAETDMVIRAHFVANWGQSDKERRKAVANWRETLVSQRCNRTMFTALLECSWCNERYISLI